MRNRAYTYVSNEDGVMILRSIEVEYYHGLCKIWVNGQKAQHRDDAKLLKIIDGSHEGDYVAWLYARGQVKYSRACELRDKLKSQNTKTEAKNG